MRDTVKTTVNAYLYSTENERTKKPETYIGVETRVAASHVDGSNVTTWAMTAALSLDDAAALMERLRACLLQSSYYTGAK